MTPNNKTKLKNEAQMRSVSLMFGEPKEGEQLIESKYYVEGYAARFEPYVLWEDDEGPVYEAFDRDCFVGTDMSDIIFQYDHEGRVLARTGNGTLVVRVDDNGLFMAADLSKTEAARQLYDEIQAGMVTKMSWRFSLGDCEYDPEISTIVHHSIKKIWDVSAVSIPANDNTEINARSFGDGLIAEAARRDAELDDIRTRIKIKTKI